MANRHLARSIVMQSLFEWDFNGCDDSKIDEIVSRNIEEFAAGLGDDGFVRTLVVGIIKKRKKIDAVIEKAAPEWPINQIAQVDRNVLRIGLYELLFGNRGEVPPKVAINEAIELAKTFGGDSSGRFVNGVLGTVYRELGEPGKEEVSPKDKKSKADILKLPVESLGGGVVYRKDGDKIYFAMVHDVFGYWTLSKGHLEGEEDVKEGTMRELKEELGIKELLLSEEIGVNEYIALDPEKGPVRRRVVYFLVETPEEKLTLGTSGGLDDVRWFGPEEFKEIKTYPDIRPILDKAVDLLTK
ncbi:MAG: transcription antitermination factor NusB [Candidatus Niyogibacteria bacterium CG10_big_fil_rev_8_21_14_0_10_42_19]|uniref:Transcription antitermination protein NusB n=1 Tax=Candidatus Niyogibacteria bacterium CG10_big_fil_rev_8_21_14_0_10_42_19 TaxID=1974725 RepID=A0A2H0TFX9_9BACT|nr:MAG: transcription antitermination factor NusB [Candidatus Niyogibacteria bacterium CG10_big_fil_rev_8_21_14_0_10_42_19]